MAVWLIGIVWPVYQVFSQEKVIHQLSEQIDQWQDAAQKNRESLEEIVQRQQALQEQATSVVTQVNTMDVTAYTPCVEETDDDPLIAASMRKVRLGTVAVSRDLFEKGWVFGKKVYIEGYGIYEINDLMNKRFSSRVDVFMWEKKDALEFGKKTLKVALLDL
ncbi:MAG: hypothetical protein ACLFQR_00695 [Desulfovibrionales bacterium]